MNTADKFTHEYVPGLNADGWASCAAMIPNEDGELEACGWKADSIAHRRETHSHELCTETHIGKGEWAKSHRWTEPHCVECGEVIRWSGSEFHPGDVIETSRARRVGWTTNETFHGSRRFVVVEIHGAAGFLVVVPDGQTHRRPHVNDWTVYIADARRPAPGELTEEYGR